MKFKLIVEDALDDGREFQCPLMLDGHETEDEAIARFRDSLAVFRDKLATEEGRSCIMSARIDGRPTPEYQAQHDRTWNHGKDSHV